MAAIPVPQAVTEAYARRVERADQEVVRFQWYIKEVSDKVSLSMRNRVRMATTYLLSKITQNISVPVIRGRRESTGRVYVIDRSKSGEFPRAETSTLMRSLLHDVVEPSPGIYDGRIGTPLMYGLVLETRMNRSFLVRTLNDERAIITRMLAGPIT